MRCTALPPTPATAANPLPRPGRCLIGLAAALCFALPAGARAQDAAPVEPPPKVATISDSQNLDAVPTDVGGLLDLDARIRRVVDKVLPATVGLMVGNAQGSGVIVSPTGLVLTAAHVSGRPGESLRVVMPDGTQYRAVSLGRNQELDDGLVRIVDDAAKNLPFVPLGKAADLPPGTWTVALGHPGGYQQDRPPVVRVGRLLVNGRDLILTDNTLVGGDSGGPLFDLDGRLIAIHSRIGDRIQANIHVPVDRFLDDWQTLLTSQDAGDQVPAWMRNGPQRATDGMQFDTGDLTTRGALVTNLAVNGPADAAGIQINDRILAFDGQPVENGQDLILKRLALRPGEAVTYRLSRNGEERDVQVVPVRLTRRNRGNEPQNPGRPNPPPDDGDRPNNAMQPDDPVLGFQPTRRANEPGVQVADVTGGSPAEAAGLLPGDLLTTVNGRLVRDSQELHATLEELGVGATVDLTVRRDGRDVRLKCKVGRYGDVFPGR